MPSRCHSEQEFLGDSGSHWRVIKASAVALPSMGMEVGDWSRQSRVLVWRSPLPPSMHAMLIEICLEIEQLVFQIRCGPEQRAIQILASNRADQSLHKRMGERNMGTVLISVTSSIRRLACHCT